jgi:hypothetical protein
MSHRLEKTRQELCSKIKATEENYLLVNDLLSGSKYSGPEVKDTLQALKDNLCAVNKLFIFAQIDVIPERHPLPIDDLLESIDFALTLMSLNPVADPRTVLQTTLKTSHAKIKDAMKTLSLIKEVCLTQSEEFTKISKPKK